MISYSLFRTITLLKIGMKKIQKNDIILLNHIFVKE